MSPLGRYIASICCWFATAAEFASHGARSASNAAFLSSAIIEKESEPMNRDLESLQETLERFILPRLRDVAAGWPFPLYLVGGVVRTFLMAGCSTKDRDVDLVTQGEIAALAHRLADRLGGHVFPLNEGTWRIVFRADDRQQWQLDISKLKGESIETDLSRRDFTINALAWEVGSREPRILDPLRGRLDLEKRIIRCCSPQCFWDDPLRLLRAIRFQAQLGFLISEETLQEMKERAPLLAGVSRERVRDEFFQILAAQSSWRHLQLLKELGLLEQVVPGVEAMYGLHQGVRHRLPLWEHSLETVRALEALLPQLPCFIPSHGGYAESRLKMPLEGGIDIKLALKLVALLHDLGKPFTRTVDDTGKVRFRGHEEEGRARIGEICRSLRLGRKTKDWAEQLVGSHLRPVLLSAEEQWTRRAKFRFFRDLKDSGFDLLLLGWADLQATVGEEDPQLLRYRSFFQEMIEYYREDFMVQERGPLVRGNDLIREFGLRPGRKIGILLEKVREAQAEGRLETKEEALDLVRDQLARWSGVDEDGVQSGEEK